MNGRVRETSFVNSESRYASRENGCCIPGRGRWEQGDSENMFISKETDFAN